MTPARSPLLRALVLGLALLIYYAAIGIASDPGKTRNERDVAIPRAGYLATARTPGVVSVDNALVIPAGSAWSSAAWDVSSYEVSHLVNNARGCRIDVFITGSELTSNSARGTAEIRFNGSVVQRIAFSNAQRGFYPFAPGRYVPSNVIPQSVDVVPLDRRYGFVIPLSADACAKQRFIVSIRARDVDWNISAAGLELHYTPSGAPLFHSSSLTLLVGAILGASLVVALFAVLYGLSSFGFVPLICAVLVLVIAPLTHDQWDFPLWIRFSEMGSFGGANPAHLWDASPLWTIVPTLFSTVTLASYLATGDGSRTLTEILLKIGMAIAYCYSAYAICAVAPKRLRRLFAVVSLLVPAGLYEVAGGYREPFAASLMLLAFTLSRRRAFAAGAVAFCAAASISETLLPLVVFPAALALCEPGSLRKRSVRCVLLASLGIGLFALEWLLLIPRSDASHALVYRFGEAPLGAASWAGALDGLGFLPQWLPVRSALFGAAIFLVAATVPALQLVATLRDPILDAKRRYVDLVRTFACFVAAFFLAFRGIDPNIWYLLLVVSLYYFALADASNPFPLIFGTVSSLVFYGALGFGDFIDHDLLWPFDRGLLGILGVSHYVFALVQTGLAICFIIALSRRNTSMLFSRRSPWFFILFAAAVGTTAIRFYAADFAIVTMTCTIVTLTLARMVDARRSRFERKPNAIARAAGATLLAGFGAICGTQSAAAGVAASGALLASFTGMGLCDFILAIGSTGVLAVQKGFGWTSIFGWAILVIVVLTAIAGQATRSQLGRYSK